MATVVKFSPKYHEYVWKIMRSEQLEICILNKWTPKTDPCGTATVQLVVWDLVESMRTDWLRTCMNGTKPVRCRWCRSWYDVYWEEFYDLWCKMQHWGLRIRVVYCQVQEAGRSPQCLQYFKADGKGLKLKREEMWLRIRLRSRPSSSLKISLRF